MIAMSCTSGCEAGLRPAAIALVLAAVSAVSVALAAAAEAGEAEGAVPGLAPVTSVEIGDRGQLLVDGEPFFPIMSWAQDPGRFQLLASLGFNTFCGSGGPPDQVLAAAQAAGGWAIVGARAIDSTLVAHPALLAYNLPDEPDLGMDREGPRTATEEVARWYAAARRADPAHPVFLNLTAAFMTRSAGTHPEARTYYETVARAADILCFDIYPVYGWNRDDRLTWVADGVAELRALAPGKPVWAFVETSKGSKWITYERQKEVTPAIVRSEVWMSVIRGATGIGYFTHAWRPAFTEFAPTDAVRAELDRTNGQLTRLAAVILSGPTPDAATIAFDDGLHGEVMARRHADSLYLFANLLDMEDLGARRDDVVASYRPGRATMSVAGLRAGARVDVVDEGRQVIADEGGFSDDFEPLGVHIYRIAR